MAGCRGEVEGRPGQMVKGPVSHGKKAELSPELQGSPPMGSPTAANMFTGF